MKIGKTMKSAAMTLCFVSISFTYAVAQGFNSLSDCLVANNIGKFTYEVSDAQMGKAAGFVGGADHFDLDHADTFCDGGYSNINEVSSLQTREEIINLLMSVKVEVTQHVGCDSDRWLLHELDAEFRTYYGIPGKSYSPEQINGQTILQDDVAGANYRWLSGNKVIEIKYNDPQMTKPEPLEIVKAYLAKHPSTLAPITLQQLRSNENEIKWIKDEIDRRLWLCDKWNAQYQAGKTTQDDLIDNLVKNMKVFLDYREKYYSIAATEDLSAIRGYVENKDLASIQTKLAEYKAWWASNKSKSISLASNNTNNTWKKYAIGGGAGLAAGVGLAVYFLRRS